MQKKTKVKINFKRLFILILFLYALIYSLYTIINIPIKNIFIKNNTLLTDQEIIEIAKIVWFILWAMLVIMIFYSGFLFLTDQWKSENMKKAKNIIIWVLLWGLVVFMLLLIMYQLFAEFA